MMQHGRRSSRRVSARVRRNRFFATVGGVAVIATIVGVSVATAGGRDDAATPSPPAGSAPAPAAVSPAEVAPTAAAPAPSPTFNRQLYSIDDPASLWVVNDKLRPLNPIDWVPPDLVTAEVPSVSNSQMRAEAASAVATMFAAGIAEGAGGFAIQNAYRSFSVQTRVHNRLIASLGQEAAEAQSARPGYSEHQTGLSADIQPSSGECSIQQCFGQTSQGIWLAANAWRFGFTLRYPEGKQDVTGYIYEPWHYRYVGVELATELHSTGISTLEEYFGLSPAPDYAD